MRARLRQGRKAGADDKPDRPPVAPDPPATNGATESPESAPGQAAAPAAGSRDAAPDAADETPAPPGEAAGAGVDPVEPDVTRAAASAAERPAPAPSRETARASVHAAEADGTRAAASAAKKPAPAEAGEPATPSSSAPSETETSAPKVEPRPESRERGNGPPPTDGGKPQPRSAPPADGVAAVATAPDGPQPVHAGALLGRVLSVAGSLVWGMLEPNVANLAEIGAVVRLHNGRGKSVGLITTLKANGRRGEDRRLVEVRLLGEILEDGVTQPRFQRGVSSYPPLDSEIHAATSAELAAMYAPPETSTVRLGTLSHTSNLPAYAITDNLLGKHFAVLGSTGAGKSCAVTVILRAILDANPYGHVIMLDPHNEYGRAFGERAELLNPSNLKLPYWLLNYEEMAALLVSNDSEQSYAEAAILKDALLGARRGFADAELDAEQITVDTPIPYRLSELVKQIKEAMGAFNRPESTAAYQHLISRIESLSGDKRYDFMFSSFLVQDTMHQVLSRILRIPVEGRPITIIDISGVPSEIVDVVVSVLFRLIFEFALWSDRSRTPPILLVCEEAHRYVPGDDQAAFAPTKRSISRIAKEGRKYGLSLGLVTQRPSELSTSSLSQCNTIFALRLSNDRDLEFVRAAVTDSSRWLTDTLPALNTQEAVVLGDGVSVPMHIRFNDLDPESRPASTTPAFSTVWQTDVEAEPLISQTIERWRHQIRPAKADH